MTLQKELKTLKQLRFEKDVTQADIYNKTAIWMSKLSGIENGYLVATEDEKKKIAKVLKVGVNSIDWGE